MEQLVIYIFLKDYVMNCYTKEILILFRIMISPLCQAYKSFQYFCWYFSIICQKKIRPWCRQNQIGICQTCLPQARGVQEGQRKVRHPVCLQGIDQIDVTRSEENSINAWNVFLWRGSCSYDDETIGDIEVPLRYKHLVKKWVPMNLPQLNIYFM